jgi:hypothetical protein
MTLTEKLERVQFIIETAVVEKFFLTPEEVADEQLWDEQFADPRSDIALERLAEKARADRRAGRTQPLDPDQL